LSSIQQKCPELLEIYLQTNLFKLPETTDNEDNDDTPLGMAKRYNIAYLGKLPMDPNMMRSCEEGKCFLECYPTSTASKAFIHIIEKIIQLTTTN
jgi:MinD-like ATPase involved in chromosome partitioning or flagellar assembly